MTNYNFPEHYDWAAQYPRQARSVSPEQDGLEAAREAFSDTFHGRRVSLEIQNRLLQLMLAVAAWPLTPRRTLAKQTLNLLVDTYRRSSFIVNVPPDDITDGHFLSITGMGPFRLSLFRDLCRQYPVGALPQKAPDTTPAPTRRFKLQKE